MSNCAICDKTSGLFDLVIPGDDDEESTKRQICGKCWGVISHIALLAVQGQLSALNERIEKIEEHEISEYEAAMIVERGTR